MAESLASIDFADVEPPLDPPSGDVVSATDWFAMRRLLLPGPRTVQEPGECALVALLEGRARCGDVRLVAGDVALLPPGAPPDGTRP